MKKWLTRGGLLVVILVLAITLGPRAAVPVSGNTGAYYEEIGQGCGKPDSKKVMVYHVNGVWTPPEDALMNYKAMVQFIKSILSGLAKSSGIYLGMSYKYNPTNGKAADVIEFLQQLNQLAPIWQLKWLSKGILPPVLPVRAAETLAKTLTNTTSIEQAAIDAHAAAYKADLDACNNVLLVPHSQGNVYVHMAYDRLAALISSGQENRLNVLRVVGVASPEADTRATGASYWNQYTYQTSGKDLVMGFVSAYLNTFPLGPGRLPSNTTWNVISPVTWFTAALGHSFAGYLTIGPAKGAVATDLANQLLALPYGGCPQFSQDTYTASPSTPPLANKATVALMRKSAPDSETVYVDTGALGTAVAGMDYKPIFLKPVQFAAKQSTTTVDISILNNPARTTTRTVPLLLNQIAGGAPLGARIAAVLEIPPGTDPTCTDPSPNILAVASAGSSGDTQNQPSPSINLSANGATALAGGTKGNVSVNTSYIVANYAPGLGRAQIEYSERFMVTLPGKSGSGTAILSVSGSAVANGNCFAGNFPHNPPDSIDASASAIVSDALTFRIGYEGRYICGAEPGTGSPPPTSTPINFTYGGPKGFAVVLAAQSRNNSFTQNPSGSSAQASASLSYTITVQNDPDAKVTWCRATPP